MWVKGFFPKNQLWQTSEMEIFIERPLDGSVVKVFPLFFQWNVFGFEKFREGEGKYILDNIASAKRGGDFLTQHLGIASRYINDVFAVGKPAGKLLPSIYKLDFVKHEDGFVFKHFFVCLLDEVKVTELDVCQTVILKIEVEELFDGMPFLQQVVYALVKHI